MFEEKEAYQIFLSILLIAYLIAFAEFTLLNFLIGFIFASIILLPHVIAHKVAAANYKAKSQFKFFELRRYGFAENAEFAYPLPIWLILPILALFLSLGKLKLFTIETFDLTWKSKRRIGRWYPELEESEIAMIGLAGPVINLILAFIAGVIFSFASFPIIKEFAILNAWFALFCMLPIGGLDGTKILFGGKIRWAVIFIFTLTFLVLLYFLNIYITFILALILAMIVGLWFLNTEL